MQSTRITVTIPSQYCYYVLITLLISLAITEQSSIDYGNEEDLIKRASHNHNIMRFGRAGHNIMHFGKRSGDENFSGGDSEAVDSDSYNTEQLEPPLDGQKPITIGQRSVRTRYFIPHAFIASLYTHPRPFLKKAAESRDNVFMHFG